MNFRENTLAILNYEKFDKMPVVSFGYWRETALEWAEQGHITMEEAKDYQASGDNSAGDNSIMKKLGFDFNWNSCISSKCSVSPGFEKKILEKFPDGSQIVVQKEGLINKEKPGTVSIPSEIGTLLTGREAWEELYLPKLQMFDARVNIDAIKNMPDVKDRQIPMGLHVGSLIGKMRDLLGVEEFSYLYVDDEELYIEIIDTICNLCYQCAKLALDTNSSFDYAHFWEDICFKNGPLVVPSVFKELVGPWYKKITSLINSYGINIISLDCDGMIDKLVPIWLENGVNTMFPIEVGTWHASIEPWRKLYGKELRGVGGMNKNVFTKDKAAIDEEIERLLPLMNLGGYIPCPDHRIPPNSKFELVQYYCDKMQNIKL